MKVSKALKKNNRKIMEKYKTTISKISLIREKTEILKSKLTSSKDVYDYVLQFYKHDLDIYESLFILLLDRANNTTGFAKISQGGTGQTLADIKLIAKYAITSLSPAVVLVHNHPSGNVFPSKDDLLLTKKVKKALKLFDIQLLDHLIISKNKYYSFIDEDVNF